MSFGQLGYRYGGLGQIGKGVTTPYIGQVATRSMLPSSVASFGGTNQSMNRTRHVMRASTNAVALVYSTWWYNQATQLEVAMGGAGTVTASIEYPVGTFTQVKWGGSATGTLPNNTNTISDFMPVSIPVGSVFFIRTYWTGASGMTYVASTSGLSTQTVMDITNGEANQWAASGVTDKTLGGTCTAVVGANGGIICPTAIVGQTTTPSFYFLGDSRTRGQGDSYNDTSTNIGAESRSIGPFYGYINGGGFGDRAGKWITNAATNRIALSKYSSHVLSSLGINDLEGTDSVATLTANLLTIWTSQLAATRIIQATLSPQTTSTDSWATTANQSTVSSNSLETKRVAFNTNVRTGLPGTLGNLELADVAEGTRNSGKWIVNGTTFYATFDGIHETPIMNGLYNTSGTFNSASIHYP